MTKTRISMAWTFVAVVLCTAAPRAQAIPDVSAWRAQLEQIPIGAIVKLRTTDGERMKAVLLAKDDQGIVVKPATRIPEPSRRLSYGQLYGLERYEDHVSTGKYVGIGAAIGAAVMLLLLAGAS